LQYLPLNSLDRDMRDASASIDGVLAKLILKPQPATSIAPLSGVVSVPEPENS
jgi:hypothetical protein